MTIGTASVSQHDFQVDPDTLPKGFIGLQDLGLYDFFMVFSINPTFALPAT